MTAAVIVRLFRLALRLLPERMREQYGDEMVDQLAWALQSVPGRGGVRRIVLGLQATADVVRVAPMARYREHARERRLAAKLPDPSYTDTPMRDSFVHDLRYAGRGLLRHPGFTAVAVLALALGIGAATTIFSVVNGVLMRPLPYRAPDRLVNIWNDLGDGAQSLPAVSAADYLDYPHETTLFEEFAAGSGPTGSSGILTGAGDPERVEVSSASANFFPLLGVDPMLGRGFTADEEQFRGPRAVMLTHALWVRRYGSDTSIVGKTILLDGVPNEVVGVLPPGFRLLLPSEAFLIRDAELWKPLQFNRERMPPRNFTGFTVFGRLRPGVTVAQAQAEMNAVATRFRERHAVHRASNLRIRVVSLHHDVVKGVRPALLILLVAAGMLVVIACANVANLVLARATGRERELAVRLAMGASRSRIVRQMMTESAVLALAGGAMGLLLTYAALAYLAYLQPANLPRLSSVRVDWVVLTFVASVCVGTTILFGLAPALHGARSGVGDVMRSAGRVAGHGRAARLRQGLVVAEVALTLVLLVAAGLMVRSFIALQQVRPGFDPNGAITFQLALPSSKYPSSDARLAFVEGIERRLRALPGVSAVGVTTQLPLTGSGPLQPYAYNEETREKWESVTADGRTVSGDFFTATGTRLLAGRTFARSDDQDAPPVIIVDATLAARAWPGESAIGKRLQVDETGSDDPFATVVGVVEHVRLHDLSSDGLSQIYSPVYAFAGSRLSFVVRANSDLTPLAAAIRREIGAADPELPVNDLVPLSSFVETARAHARFSLLLMQLVAGIALVLAAIGIYGVIAYSVGQRMKEFGVRMALGEAPSSLRLAVLGQSLRLVAASVVVGLAAAALSTRFLGRLLYGVSPTDPLTFGSVAAFLLVVSGVAALTPAWRASRADPLAALRAE
ncbi:MAG TPA: ABC transporter permease [Gemmatimonadaceae bacterium]|jgi:predicted permease|nr:ABC transporter permease [Gemmatimonadaceae bacterium]